MEILLGLPFVEKYQAQVKQIDGYRHVWSLLKDTPKFSHLFATVNTDQYQYATRVKL